MSAVVAVVGRRWRRIVVCIVAVFLVYQAVIGALLVVGLGGRPNFVRTYPVWANARRIVALTPSVSDVVVLLAREPIVEYGRLHPQFGAAVWSFELTWSSLLFYLSFSALLGVALGLGGAPPAGAVSDRSAERDWLASWAPACRHSLTAGSGRSGFSCRSPGSRARRSSGSGASSRS